MTTQKYTEVMLCKKQKKKIPNGDSLDFRLDCGFSQGKDANKAKGI